MIKKICNQAYFLLTQINGHDSYDLKAERILFGYYLSLLTILHIPKDTQHNSNYLKDLHRYRCLHSLSATRDWDNEQTIHCTLL